MVRKHRWSSKILGGNRICMRICCYAEWFRGKTEPTGECKGT